MNGLSTLKTGIQALVKEIDTITLISEFWVKVAVYWGVCTWGHDELNKFPVLRFVGDSESGKSELTKIIRDISRADKDGKNFYGDIKAWKEPAIREELNKAAEDKTSCFFDEGDEFPNVFWEAIHDRSNSVYKDMGGKTPEKNFSERTFNLWAPVCMNGRVGLGDVSRQNRTIEIKTLRVQEGAPQGYIEGQFTDKRLTCQLVAKNIKWEEVESNQGSRIKQNWAPIKAVAENLGDEEFLGQLEDYFEEHKRMIEEQREEELLPKVWDTIVELCYNYRENSDGSRKPYPKWQGEFPKQLDIKEVANQSGKLREDVGRAASLLGIPKRKIGTMRLDGLTPQFLKELGVKHGFPSNEWLDDEAAAL